MARGFVVSTALTPICACGFWGPSSNFIITIAVEAGRVAAQSRSPNGDVNRVRVDHGRAGRASKKPCLANDDRIELQLGLRLGRTGAHENAPARSKAVRPRMTVRMLVGNGAPGDRSGSIVTADREALLGSLPTDQRVKLAGWSTSR